MLLCYFVHLMTFTLEPVKLAVGLGFEFFLIQRLRVPITSSYKMSDET